MIRASRFNGREIAIMTDRRAERIRKIPFAQHCGPDLLVRQVQNLLFNRTNFDTKLPRLFQNLFVFLRDDASQG